MKQIGSGSKRKRKIGGKKKRKDIERTVNRKEKEIGRGEKMERKGREKNKRKKEIEKE